MTLTALTPQLTSGQPTIIDNKKKLNVNFKIFKTQLDEKPASPAMTLNFGVIQPGATAMAQFYMTASLTGTFVSFDATYTYLTPTGDQRLCQVQSLKIHELVAPVMLERSDNVVDFLVNDYPDLNFLPDTVYSSSGDVFDVTPRIVACTCTRRFRY